MRTLTWLPNPTMSFFVQRLLGSVPWSMWYLPPPSLSYNFNYNHKHPSTFKNPYRCIGICEGSLLWWIMLVFAFFSSQYPSWLFGMFWKGCISIFFDVNIITYTFINNHRPILYFFLSREGVLAPFLGIETCMLCTVELYVQHWV